MNPKELREHEENILLSLVEFFYEHGYKSTSYMDATTGGIYENKLGHQLGYAVTAENLPSPEFILAATMLESKGYVRRVRRNPDSPLMGIWPTNTGLEYAEFLKAPWHKKILLIARRNQAAILSSVVTAILTTVATLLVASFLGLFGLKK